MNRSILFSLSFAVLVMGCAPQPTPLRIERFLPVDGLTCASNDKASASGGLLDLAPQGTPSFHVGLIVVGANAFQTEEIKLSNGTVLEPQDRNRPVLDKVVFTYTARPTSLGLKLDAAEVSRSIPILDDGTAVVANINLISPQAADELLSKMAAGDEADIDVAVEVRGRMSGNGNAITTGPLVFPIHVYYSDPSQCAGPVVQSLPGECSYPGQSTDRPATVCCGSLLPGTPGCP
jgi:hypothetical protein